MWTLGLTIKLVLTFFVVYVVVRSLSQLRDVVDFQEEHSHYLKEDAHDNEE